jgi:hypothetical protein
MGTRSIKAEKYLIMRRMKVMIVRCGGILRTSNTVRLGSGAVSKKKRTQRFEGLRGKGQKYIAFTLKLVEYSVRSTSAFTFRGMKTKQEPPRFHATNLPHHRDQQAVLSTSSS